MNKKIDKLELNVSIMLEMDNELDNLLEKFCDKFNKQKIGAEFATACIHMAEDILSRMQDEDQLKLFGNKEMN
jgi:hypothetical protein